MGNALSLRSTFASQSIFEHFTDLLEWFENDASADSWTSWHESNLAWIHKLPLKQRVSIYLVQFVPVRIILIISSLVALEVNELTPVSLGAQRELLSLTVGLGAVITAAVAFAVSYPVSLRHMFQVDRLFDLESHYTGMPFFSIPLQCCPHVMSQNLWIRFFVFWLVRIGAQCSRQSRQHAHYKPHDVLASIFHLCD